MRIVKRLLRVLKRELKTLRDLVYHRLYISRKLKTGIIDQFHTLYYESDIFHKTFWLGTITAKCPLDLWIYQEIIFELRPEIIIECGTSHGGSALFLACMCDLVDSGKVITIDVEEKEHRPKHRRIQYLLGSSTSEEIVSQVREQISCKDKVMVVLDSDHSKEHVLEELRIYSKFVSTGSYVIVEDTNVNGHPVVAEFGPGPMEAVDEFLKGDKSFVVDKDREKFYMSFSPRGYLRRRK